MPKKKARARGTWRGQAIYTFGHSTRTAEELVEICSAFALATVVDVRTVPRSRHNPQSSGPALGRTLRRAGVGYAHIAELGGLRRPRKESVNAAWRNASFRGYADHLLTEEFAAGLEKLLALLERGPAALMCAEAVPWRCHRSLIADVLTARGARVEHIMSSSQSRPHVLTPFARVKAGRVTYPAAEA